jgi:carotenoid cleavage dioxygenase
MSENPYLSGNFAPVDGERTDYDLKVTGALPRELQGSILRIGPNPVNPDPASHHWFLGNGMVHGVQIEDGQAKSYRRRFVRDDEVTEHFGWPPVQGPKPEFELGAGVANTHVIPHAGRIFAIVEAGNLPVELDANLETIGRCNFDGTLPGGLSAHPHRDPKTGELHAAVYSPAWDYVQYVVVGTDARVRKTVNVPLPGRPMIHDCAITENYFVILDLPCILPLDELDPENPPTGLPYRWRPDYGARVGLLPREGTAEDVIWSEVDPCYVFHPMNAFEDSDGRVVMDVVRHQSMFSSDTRGPNEGRPTLDRWTIDPKGGPVKEHRLDDRGLEFPRLDERRTGQSYRYGYTAGFGNVEDDQPFAALMKHDLRDDKVEVHYEGKTCNFMEPVFVPRSADAGEDEGWILAYNYDAATNKSNVVVIEAQDFEAEPVATIQLPDRVPFGFHGSWVPSQS